eukprot:30234-Pelagococcus_subviridis.AAC.4
MRSYSAPSRAEPNIVRTASSSSGFLRARSRSVSAEEDAAAASLRATKLELSASADRNARNTSSIAVTSLPAFAAS